MTRDTNSIANSVLNHLAMLARSDWLPDPTHARLTLLAEGVHHLNFVLVSADQTSVVRVNRSSQWGLASADQLAREYAVLEDLITSGVAPRPLALVTDAAAPFLVECHLKGAQFQYSRADLEHCAHSIAAAHAANCQESAAWLSPEDGYEFLLRDGLSRVEKARESVGDTSATDALFAAHQNLGGLVPDDSSEPVLVHTDLIQGNMLRTAHGCALLDWEGARLGPRAWDLAYFLSPVTLRWASPPPTLTRTDGRAFIETYARTAGVDAASTLAEVGLMMPFVVFRALAWCAEHVSTAAHISGPVRSLLVDFLSEAFIDHHLTRWIS